MVVTALSMPLKLLSAIEGPVVKYVQAWTTLVGIRQPKNIVSVPFSLGCSVDTYIYVFIFILSAADLYIPFSYKVIIWIFQLKITCSEPLLPPLHGR